MSYKYGLNGNDIEWSEMEFLNQFYEEIELDIFNGEIELDEYGDIPEGLFESYLDGNPTMIYYSGDRLDIQKVLAEGKKIDEYLDWYIIHDTNDNFVTFVGDVPDKYLTEQYIAERDEAEGVI
jgi:hypothetical protein